MTTSQNNPFATWQNFWQNQGTSVGQASNTAQNFWQANACYWQTVGSIMTARGNSVTQWWQQLPQHLNQLASCTTAPEFIEACMKWHAQTVAQACQLTETTQTERAYLYKQWQQLAGRSGFTGTMQATSQTTWPQTGTSSTTGNGNMAQQTATPSAKAPASTSGATTWQPNFLPGRFIPGSRTTSSSTPAAVQATPMPQTQTTSASTPATGTEQQVSSTATSFSRSSTAAAQMVAATTRRSVLARNAGRPRRAAGGR